MRVPNCDRWIPYNEAGWKIGQTFGEAHGSNAPDNPIKLSKAAVNSFVEATLKDLEKPTIAIIKAEKWRKYWRQLLVNKLAQTLNTLEFEEASYSRSDERFRNLLGIVRLRFGDETPQYITDRKSWQQKARTKDLRTLSGFIDVTDDEVFHYFSVGRIPKTLGSVQSKKSADDPYKIEEGGGVSFKHQRMVEMLPFFVRSDFKCVEGKTLLCRVPHYLRSSPAWSMGNLVLAYPMHLGDLLLQDHLCILRNR